MAGHSKNDVRVSYSYPHPLPRARDCRAPGAWAVFRSLKHIYAQVIDDRKGHTLVAASSSGKSTSASGGNVAGAKEIGKLIAQRAKEKGISKVVFDRGGFLYHGRIKALADAAREAGLEF